MPRSIARRRAAHSELYWPLLALTSTLATVSLPVSIAWSFKAGSSGSMRSSLEMSATTETKMDELYYSPSDHWEASNDSDMIATSPAYSQSDTGALPGTKVTLTRWLSAKVQDLPELRDMESLHLSIQMACKTISNLIHSSSGMAPTAISQSPMEETHPGTSASNNPSFKSMKRLDKISKTVLQNALRFTGRLRVMEAPQMDDRLDEDKPAAHQPGVTIAIALDQYAFGKDMSRKMNNGVNQEASGNASKWGNTRRLAAYFDPLDGSGNADAAICTGTIFGVFDADAAFNGEESLDLTDESSLASLVLQPGNKLLAAGYCLYSSSTILVFSLGGGTHGFTLDPTINEFVLTHPNMKIPKRGNIYSCNEAYSEGWDENFKRYLKALKTGTGQTGQKYTQRYIGSMAGDVHRTLSYGGIFCCPSDTDLHPKGNLQLVYKSAPMAYILEHAGGKSSNGSLSLLAVTPKSVHERSPAFMGSSDDMDELLTYIGSNDVGLSLGSENGAI